MDQFRSFNLKRTLLFVNMHLIFSTIYQFTWANPITSLLSTKPIDLLCRPCILSYKLQPMTHISESDVTGANLVMLESSVLQAKLTQVRKFHWAADIVLFSYLNKQENSTRYQPLSPSSDIISYLFDY